MSFTERVVALGAVVCLLLGAGLLLRDPAQESAAGHAPDEDDDAPSPALARSSGPLAAIEARGDDEDLDEDRDEDRDDEEDDDRPSWKPDKGKGKGRG